MGCKLTKEGEDSIMSMVISCKLLWYMHLHPILLLCLYLSKGWRYLHIHKSYTATGINAKYCKWWLGTDNPHTILSQTFSGLRPFLFTLLPDLHNLQILLCPPLQILPSTYTYKIDRFQTLNVSKAEVALIHVMESNASGIPPTPP